MNPSAASVLPSLAGRGTIDAELRRIGYSSDVFYSSNTSSMLSLLAGTLGLVLPSPIGLAFSS